MAEKIFKAGGASTLNFRCELLGPDTENDKLTDYTENHHSNVHVMYNCSVLSSFVIIQ